MKIIYNKILPFKGYKAITLWPFIFVKKECSFNKIDLNHEQIHGEQQKELLIIPFYIIYLIEWVFKGYKNISFEREAYYYEYDLDYLNNRRYFNWINFLI